MERLLKPGRQAWIPLTELFKLMVRGLEPEGTNSCLRLPFSQLLIQQLWGNRQQDI
jgi:hypothetical protein